MKSRWIYPLVVLLTLTGTLQGRYEFFTPDGSFAIEISLENSSELRLPMYRNAVTSLAVVNDLIIGGTSAGPGLSPFIFAASLSGRRLEKAIDMERVIPGQLAVKSGFVRDKDGTLFAGTVPQELGESGHLMRVSVGRDGLEIKDLGFPVPEEGIFALALDAVRQVIYGISHPSGQFFTYQLVDGTAKIFEETVPSERTVSSLGYYGLEPEDYLSRALVLDREGKVYGSQPGGRVFRFDPVEQSFEVLADPLPEVWGRAPLARVDSWAVSPEGILFGGNAADGQLFKLNPKTGVLTNLGKPIMMPRLKALAFAGNGKLYGVAGGTPGYAHLFSYDPEGKGFRDLGNPRFVMVAPGIEQGVFWRGFQIATMAVSEDGKYVVLGEDEALSQLMVFPVTADN
jgi:hypothetical protein